MHLHDLVIAAPTIFRYSMPWIKEVVTHVYHEHVVHGGIHAVSRRSHKVHGLLHRVPWLVDIVIVAAMVIASPFIDHAADGLLEKLAGLSAATGAAGEQRRWDGWDG